MLSAQTWNWKVQRANEVNARGEAIAQTDFKTDAWIAAPVPGTVARAWQEAGKLEDIRYDDNLTRIDDGFFNADFWYRTEFDAPALKQGERLILHFDGINWKAEVYVNGKKMGSLHPQPLQHHAVPEDCRAECVGRQDIRQ